MWSYDKRLQFPVKIKNPDPQTAKIVMTQLGGPDGELGASMRYLNQRYAMPYKECKAILTDIGTEELAHMEMISAIVYQLTRNLTPEQIKEGGFDAYFVDHATGIYPQFASGTPWSAMTFQSKGDPITDLFEDMAAEQKARSTYDNLLRLIDNPDVREPLKFLREREIVHFQRFGEANREDCSKNSRVLKAHKYSIFGNLLSIRKMQDVGISFASVHAIAPFRFEGLGHFPTSNFQPTHRRTGGRKYGKGYSFPMLAKKVFSYYLQCRKGLFCQRVAKEKRRNPATLQELYVDENEGTLFPRLVIVGFLYAFCSSRHNF